MIAIEIIYLIKRQNKSGLYCWCQLYVRC